MMAPQLTMPSVAQPTDPTQVQHSQMLAQILQQMGQAKPQTPAALGADLAAQGINTFGQQGAGQAGQNQWRGANGAPSGNWMDSPLGKRMGGLFGMGQAAPNGGAAGGAYVPPGTVF